ncbi:RluA family pseudouridine synthase [Desulfonatronovibrio hydrogenovorans]|uniref:RluA family pseudouridine synthase n=1 Tax=Desulfonatronovibrio hydrogenovorans TaxID=53245 RepID=UPI0006905C4F|nr:RluA family pseudouridine synthase [Desulfonatronovibrio hydrogenovorans]
MALRVEHCRVTPQESGQKLLSYLKRKMGRDFPDPGLMRLIRTGQVRINKRRCKPFDRVLAGDIIRIPPHTNSEPALPAPGGPVDIHFSHPDFLVLNKPGNLPVHSGTGHSDSLVARVRQAFSDQSFPPTPAHRLDKATTGLVLFARSFQWLEYIHSIWTTADMHKTYLAWVRGVVDGGWTRMEDNLTRTAHRVKPDTHGKEARSKFRPIVQRRKMTLLAISLQTGRTHQIRVQLAQRGMPVMGDVRYGGPRNQEGVMYLHCFHLAWPGHEFRLPPGWTGRFGTSGIKEISPNRASL